jgi:hypothetical protein
VDQTFGIHKSNLKRKALKPKITLKLLSSQPPLLDRRVAPLQSTKYTAPLVYREVTPPLYTVHNAIGVHSTPRHQSTQSSCCCNFLYRRNCEWLFGFVKELVDDQYCSFCSTETPTAVDSHYSYCDDDDFSLWRQLVVSRGQIKATERHHQSQIRPHNYPQWLLVLGSCYFFTCGHNMWLMKAHVSHLLAVDGNYRYFTKVSKYAGRKTWRDHLVNI